MRFSDERCKPDVVIQAHLLSGILCAWWFVGTLEIFVLFDNAAGTCSGLAMSFVDHVRRYGKVERACLAIGAPWKPDVCWPAVPVRILGDSDAVLLRPPGQEASLLFLRIQIREATILVEAILDGVMSPRPVSVAHASQGVVSPPIQYHATRCCCCCC